MAVSLESPSNIQKDHSISMNSSYSSPLFSPSSEKRFWSALRNRVDTLLENRKLDEAFNASDLTLQASLGIEEAENSKRLRKEDCLLLLKGFDSIASSLSQLNNNLDTAVNGARELAKPSSAEALDSDPDKAEGVEGLNKRGLKRKANSYELLDGQDDGKPKENEQGLETGKLKKAKNLAVSMANKAASLARELKSIKSDLCFMQERCLLLEEENRRLREGCGKGMRPEEDDLVRLQLEALLAEKSRLATENANLIRENECLHQLVEYHQLTSQDLSVNGTATQIADNPHYYWKCESIMLTFSSTKISDFSTTRNCHNDVASAAWQSETCKAPSQFSCSVPWIL
ncbi:heat-inducible transcription repressor [Thalictrum thalictroides]|uniref:Heat-inducible transcription repressor n=1 Tax=Thalictrum thalictroides TaxID=46969 RepID=A0A7J6X8I0_THATH|nr:heat-inducible transcription repressor [Thalictrum thalictroides]